MARVGHRPWCDPFACTADSADTELERVHRSRPVTITLAPGEVLVACLAEHARVPGVTVEVVVVQPPAPVEWWRAEPLAALTLPLDPAAAVAQALRQLVRQAVAG